MFKFNEKRYIMLNIIVLVKQKIVSLSMIYPSVNSLFEYKLIVLTSSLLFMPIPSKNANANKRVLFLIFNFRIKTIVNKILIYL